MNKFFLASFAFLFAFQIGFSQGGAPRVLDTGAGDACKSDPVSFFNKFTAGEQMKFEFRTMNPTAEEQEKGILFQIDAVIATAGAGSKIVAHSMKARKVFKPGDVFTPSQVFNSEDLLFSNKHFSKLKPGKYKVIFSMSAASTANRTKYKASRKAYDFVWR